jgi:hypothetical protein
MNRVHWVISCSLAREEGSGMLLSESTHWAHLRPWVPPPALQINQSVNQPTNQKPGTGWAPCSPGTPDYWKSAAVLEEAQNTCRGLMYMFQLTAPAKVPPAAHNHQAVEPQSTGGPQVEGSL